MFIAAAFYLPFPSISSDTIYFLLYIYIIRFYLYKSVSYFSSLFQNQITIG